MADSTRCPEDNILFIALDKDYNAKYRNPSILSEFIHDRIDSNDSRMYVMIDEIQKCVEILSSEKNL